MAAGPVPPATRPMSLSDLMDAIRRDQVRRQRVAAAVRTVLEDCIERDGQDVRDPRELDALVDCISWVVDRVNERIR